MQVITDRELYRRIWDKIDSDFCFCHSADTQRAWLKPAGIFRKYFLETVWNDEQEALVNTILCDVIGEEMFALDWQHDCFLFDPNEKIPAGFQYHDSGRDCEVYFPTYYPDGDYYFFISKDWSAGLFGNPWRKELIVTGEELITAIEKNCSALGLKLNTDRR